MTDSFLSPKLSPNILDALEHYSREYKYVVNQFEFGKARDPYDTIGFISVLMKRIKELADEDFVEKRIETLKNVYFQLGKLSDNIVWNYEVHRYYNVDSILTFIKEMIEENVKRFNSIIDSLVESVKNRVNYSPEITKEIRKAQVFLIEFAKMNINPNCIQILHKAFQALSDAYYTVKWYEDYDVSYVNKVLRDKFRNAKELVSALNSSTCSG